MLFNGILLSFYFLLIRGGSDLWASDPESISPLPNEMRSGTDLYGIEFEMPTANGFPFDFLYPIEPYKVSKYELDMSCVEPEEKPAGWEPLGEDLFPKYYDEAAAIYIEDTMSKIDFGNFENIGFIGGGRNGEVNLVKIGGKEFAKKTLSINYPVSTANSLLIYQNMKASPYLVKVEYVTKNMDEDMFDILMPYIGENMKDYVRKRDRLLSYEKAAHLAHDILLALRSLHGEGIAHLDVKPENIVYDEQNNKYVLIDYDLSLPTGHLSTPVGTLVYCSPELFKFRNYRSVMVNTSPSMDLFSLGSTLLYLLEGTHLNFESDDEILNIMNGKIRPATTYYSSDELVDFLKILLYMDPQVRQSANDLLGHPFIKKFYYDMRNHQCKESSRENSKEILAYVTPKNAHIFKTFTKDQWEYFCESNNYKQCLNEEWKPFLSYFYDDLPILCQMALNPIY